MSDADSKALGALFDVVSGQLELLGQSAARPGVDVAKLKAQCFDLMLEAVGAQAQRAGNTPLLEKLETYRKRFADVRLHLIELSEDWKCGKCGSDVAGGAVVTKRAPLEAQLVCKSCRTKTALTPAGQKKLQQLLAAAAAAPDWNPAVNGFST